MEFLKVQPLEAAREKMLACVNAKSLSTENLPIEAAVGRILAADVYAAEDIPAFRRSAVDGYAVLAGDTAAAGENIPAFLTLKGRVDIGQLAQISIGSGECAEVPTGGMVPTGADAVVMCEYTEMFGADGIAVGKSAAYGENIVDVGEDAKNGALLLRRGKRILPQDVGALAAVGATYVSVYVPPKIAIISTGDELVAPGQQPTPGQCLVRDINSHAVAALARRHGFRVVDSFVLPDDRQALEEGVRRGMAVGDIVVVSGGSSKGKMDLTRPVFDAVSGGGVFTHGIAVKPGKPTILGYDDPSQTLLVGLPGHPVSAMMVFELLLGWLLRRITGNEAPPAIPGRLSCNIASSPGKVTCWPCTLEPSESGGYLVLPIFGKSGLITTLTQAMGYFAVPRDVEGLREGDEVMVELF